MNLKINYSIFFTNFPFNIFPFLVNIVTHKNGTVLLENFLVPSGLQQFHVESKLNIPQFQWLFYVALEVLTKYVVHFDRLEALAET